MSKTSLKVKNGIGHIIMQDPAHLNALDIPMDQELLALFKECEAREDVKIVILSGEGKAFSAGGDMNFFVEKTSQKDYTALSDILTNVNSLILYMKKMKKLIIAAVHGHASGGGANLALACDIIIGDTTATFTQSFAKIGLAPDAGGMYFLSKLVGPIRALDLCLSARPVSAKEAYDLGFITELTEEGHVLEKAEAYAEQLLRGALLSFEMAKVQNRAVNYKDLEEYLTIVEVETVNATFQSEDFKEGVHAFKEKRKPQFKGK